MGPWAPGIAGAADGYSYATVLNPPLPEMELIVALMAMLHSPIRNTNFGIGNH